MCNWEQYFSSLMLKLREIELKIITKQIFLIVFNLNSKILANKISLFLSILAIVYAGESLYSSKVFMIAIIFEKFRQSVSGFFPKAVMDFTELNVSIRRIETFLRTVDYDLGYSTKPIFNFKPSKRYLDGVGIIRTLLYKPPIGVCAENLYVRWKNSNQYTLQDVNFSAESTDLTAIIGGAGGGKSTFLQVLLQELRPESGRLQVEGVISYASQEPWIFSASVKQNILFGLPMNKERYSEVVRVCALERDLSLFPNNDLTIVGERGVLLSGGQKARIHLARAVYRQADIYLLDDPLSAVDSPVGKQIFQECFCGFLAGKCTILIIHQLHYLQNVNNIYILQNGQVLDQGAFSELKTRQAVFSKLLEEEDEKTTTASFTTDADNYEYPKQETKLNLEVSIFQSFVHYCKFAGGWTTFTCLVIIYLFMQVSGVLSDVFLGFWVLKEETSNGSTRRQNSPNYDVQFSEYFTITRQFCLLIYALLIALMIFFVLLRTFYFVKFCREASKNLFLEMFGKVFNSTMYFFNTHSSGHILNRFSQDSFNVDQIFPNVFLEISQLVYNIFIVLVLICVLNLWMIGPSIIFIFLCFGLFIITKPTIQQINRLTSSAKSPIYAYMSASFNGLSTIRASKAQNLLIKEFDRHQDHQYSMQYLQISLQNSLNLWSDFIGSILIAIGIFGLIYSIQLGGDHDNMGLTLYYLYLLSPCISYAIVFWNDFQNLFISVEQMIEYIEKTPQEPKTSKLKISEAWPTKGTIQFKDVSLNYAPNDPYVIKNVNLLIESGDKIGVVGRTGAGKSSLITIIFRLAEYKGQLLIDDIDTKLLHLNDLRSKISIIPQDPMLFSGTLRENLDPCQKSNNNDIWHALADVQLANVIKKLPNGLETEICEGGSNFSVGQKQLLCLVRAILQKNCIFILDEATSNIDLQTDDLIQETIRRKFKHCTVITIAHRLSTIIDSDKILVMDAGEVVEFEHPYILLQNKDGFFTSFVNGNGKKYAENLMETAKANYFQV